MDTANQFIVTLCQPEILTKIILRDASLSASIVNVSVVPPCNLGNKGLLVIIFLLFIVLCRHFIFNVKVQGRRYLIYVAGILIATNLSGNFSFFFYKINVLKPVDSCVRRRPKKPF